MLEGRDGSALASDAAVSAPRFLFYSHDGLGLGHIRRTLCVASALVELIPDASILVVTSAEEAELFGIPAGVDLLKLPGLRKIANGHYAARRLRMTGAEVGSVRAHLLAAAVESFRPAVLLVDKHPFGVGEELLPALQAARDAGARAVLGLRDVLDDPAAVRADWSVHNVYARIPDYYDRVLVYGQPDVFDPRGAYGFPPGVTALTQFCGYVVSTTRNGAWEGGIPPPKGGRPLVLATAGGGEDGFALLSAFIEASASGDWEGIAVSGPQCPPERAQRLRTLATVAGVSVHRFDPSLSSAFPAVDALVSMGGYNSLAEAVASGVPTVCVPRVKPRSEQLIRARAFAHRGLLRLVEPQGLDAEVLRDEIDAALAAGGDPASRNGSDLDLGGARRAALHLRELAGEARRAHRPAARFAAQ